MSGKRSRRRIRRLTVTLGSAMGLVVALFAAGIVTSTTAQGAQFAGTDARLVVVDVTWNTNPLAQSVRIVNPDGSGAVTVVDPGYSASVDAAGTKVVASARQSSVITLSSPDGSSTSTIYTVASGRRVDDLTMSPDGRTVVFENADSTNATPPVLARVNVDGTGYAVISSAFTQILALQYSPDGASIVVTGTTGGVVGIHTIPVTGGTPITVVTGSSVAWASWTPDGRILFIDYQSGIDSLKRMNADGSGVTTLFTQTDVGTSSINSPMISPDGTKVAFNAPFGGQSRLWVANVDGTGSTRIRTIAGTSTEMRVWIANGGTTTTTTTPTDPPSDPVAPVFTG